MVYLLLGDHLCLPAVEALDVLEIEHVALHECLPDLLVGPRDEHLVVVVGALRQTRGKIDWDLKG